MGQYSISDIITMIEFLNQSGQLSAIKQLFGDEKIFTVSDENSLKGLIALNKVSHDLGKSNPQMHADLQIEPVSENIKRELEGLTFESIAGLDLNAISSQVWKSEGDCPCLQKK